MDIKFKGLSEMISVWADQDQFNAVNNFLITLNRLDIPGKHVASFIRRDRIMLRVYFVHTNMKF